MRTKFQRTPHPEENDEVTAASQARTGIERPLCARDNADIVQENSTGFFEFCFDQESTHLATPAIVGERSHEFMEHAWQKGDPRAWPTSARSAMVLFLPTWRCTLRGSQRLLKAWSKNELLTRATPLPPTFFASTVWRCPSWPRP